MTLQGHNIIQRQITRKLYKLALQEVVYDLSNRAIFIFDDLERPITQISRARHYSTLSITKRYKKEIYRSYWNTNTNASISDNLK